MINSRSLSDLRPDVAEKAQEFIDACRAQGIDVIITSTFRDDESQAAIYAQGRTAPGARVTNARPGESFHNYRVAFDFCPIVNGKCQWQDDALFTRCGEIGESVGLQWSGRWSGPLREAAHLQEPDLTIAELRAEATTA